MASRKTSNTSTISNVSIAEEPALDEVKEAETPLVIPSDEMCQEIVEQVKLFSSMKVKTK